MVKLECISLIVGEKRLIRKVKKFKAGGNKLQEKRNKVKQCIMSGVIQLIACLIVYLFNIPNPMIVSFVILSAVLVRFGYAAGIVSGLIAFFYSAFFFSTNHSWFLYEPINRNKLLVIGLGILSNIIIIGQLQEKWIKTNQEKTRLEKKVLEEIAYTDSMTKLENRYAYEAEKKKLEKLGKIKIIIMVCDMNGLKQINDTLGHQYGDIAICRMGQLLMESFSSIAKCYRIGGDEFCVLAKQVKMSDFETCRNHFLRVVEDTQNTECKFGAATGVAVGAASDIDRVFREADYLMYSCKKEMKKLI